MNNLKIYRINAGISQENLARICNVSLRTIQNIENKDSNPSVYLAIKIKNALQCKLEDIFISEN